MVITEEMIISGFISKIVSDVVDIPGNLIKDAIRNADKKRKEKNQSIETRIYQVTIDAIKEFTKREYKGQDVLYDAAESIIRGFKNGNKIEAVRMGLKMLGLQVISETCEDFLGTLCYEICKEGNRDLAVEVIIFQLEQTNGYMQKEFRRSYLNYEEINQKLDYLIKELVKKKAYVAEYYSENYIENRSKEYADKWNENVFLNNFNKRDENAGVNIKLSELYLEKHLPHYIWKTNVKLRYDLKDLLGEYIVNRDDKKMLLILGQPGIGKSTLITWMMANLVEKKEDVFVYQFVPDLKDVNWQEEDILEKIFIALRLRDEELKNKVLILDGFDEVSISGNRERILNKLYQELIMMNCLDNFSLIITCRENYVDQFDLKNIEYITLQAWNKDQIESFCEIYEKENIRKNSETENSKNSEIKFYKILENEEVFGIPLILYMVLALNIDVEKSSSMVDIYDQIFSLKRGGIYDRCYDIEHRINSPEVKGHIHQVSQRIAFWIFENNLEKASIPQKEFKRICDNVINDAGERNENLQSDVLIGNYFTTIKHCEGIGADDLRFVHRSIYDYFVTVYFFETVHKLTSKEEVAGKLGELLKDGFLSEQILKFIKYKFDSMEGYSLSDITKEVFKIMLRDGMVYHMGKPVLNVIDREMNIFSNMLKVVHLWNSELGKVDDKIVTYLQCNNQSMLNLAGIKLNDACLDGVNLRGANLNGAELDGADLREANLRGAKLNRAKLNRADLSEANLFGVKLNGAELNGAELVGTNLIGAKLNNASLNGAVLRDADLINVNLTETDLRGADLVNAKLIGVDLKEADLRGAVFDERQVNKLCKNFNLSGSNVCLSETWQIIGYEEYCINMKA